jgi:hypothetical protein
MTEPVSFSSILTCRGPTCFAPQTEQAIETIMPSRFADPSRYSPTPIATIPEPSINAYLVIQDTRSYPTQTSIPPFAASRFIKSP